jgi:ABC-type glycerol-3-phosphate transport system substrate-binding protein
MSTDHDTRDEGTQAEVKNTIPRGDFLSRAATGAAGLVLAGTAAAERASAAPARRRSKAPVTLTFWKGPHDTQEATGIAAPVLARFEKENPGIKVNFFLTPWDSWTEKYTTAFASGNPPDVSYMTEAMGKFALPGQLLSLDPYIATTKVSGMTFKEYLFPRMWNTATFNDKVYGIPWITGGSNLFWNKDMFAKAGLDPEKPPTTWAELIDYGKKLTKPPLQWGYVATPHGNVLETSYWGIESGGSWFNPSVTKSEVNHPAYVKGVQFFSDMFNKYQIAVPASLASVANAEYTLFTQGKAAMMSQQNTSYNTMVHDKVKFRIGAGLRPSGGAPGAQGHAAYGGVGNLSIATASAHKEEAWKLIQFLMRPDNLKAWIGSLGFMSVAPSVNFYAGNPVMTAAQKTLAYTFFFPYISNIFQVWDLLDSSLQAVALQQQTPQAAMNALAKKMDAALARQK